MLLGNYFNLGEVIYMLLPVLSFNHSESFYLLVGIISFWVIDILTMILLDQPKDNQ